MNEKIFENLLNDVVGHRILKIVVKKILEKSSQIEFKNKIID